MTNIFELPLKDGNITPEKARELRQMQLRDKQRMFGVFAIDEIFCYQGSRFPAPNLYATLNSINPREADELEQQMEKDTAMLESLQIEKREKMNKKKEAEIELEKEKRRLEKLDSKIRLFEKGDLNDDQLESRTYSEVD